METSTVFLHRSRTLIRFGSIAKVFPTRRSCSRAISYGFSRRWVGTSAVVIRLLPAWLARWRAGVYASGRYRARRGSENPEPYDLGLGGAVRRERDHPQPVRATRKDAPTRPSAGQPDRVPARKDVAQPRQDAQPLATAPELDVQPRHGAELPPSGQVAHLPRLHRQHRGGSVGGTEAPGRQADAADERRALDRQRDGPGNVESAA